MDRPKYLNDWEKYKDDLKVWRRFWALWELRRKWKWADSFYQEAHRIEENTEDIVEPKCWTLFPGPGYMRLCLWIALLKSVHEGITVGLDSYDTPDSEKVDISEVLPRVPKNITKFPYIKLSGFKDFRNAIFHCQWSPTLSKFKLDSDTTNEIESLHKKIGEWLDKEFKNSYNEFKQKYDVPDTWVFTPDGKEFMPETFY